FCKKLASNIMKEIVLQVRESEYEFVLKLLQQLNSVKVMDKPATIEIPAEKMEVLRSIQTALEEVKLIQNGQLPAKSLDQFLTEVEN
ncbi:MAG TPA: hypothetical protein PK228_06935, partial [Saprospiraceae bacterium]|nr:hypothetical protein [Saprospiraceae bacterium]